MLVCHQQVDSWLNNDGSVKRQSDHGIHKEHLEISVSRIEIVPQACVLMVSVKVTRLTLNVTMTNNVVWACIVTKYVKLSRQLVINVTQDDNVNMDLHAMMAFVDDMAQCELVRRLIMNKTLVMVSIRALSICVRVITLSN